eukprot:jgi/Botrbrau1/22433/Bobra.0091s0035.1
MYHLSVCEHFAVFRVGRRSHAIPQRPAQIGHSGRLESTCYPVKRTLIARNSATLEAPANDAPRVRTNKPDNGHLALLQGLGEVGEIPPRQMPFLLRLAHMRAKNEGGDSNKSLQQIAAGVSFWRTALDRGLVADDETLKQVLEERDSPFFGRLHSSLQWPEEPLRAVLVRGLSELGVARFCHKYPAVLDTMILSILQLACQYHKTLSGEVEQEEERPVDADGNAYMTIAELKRQEEQRRAVKMGQVIRSPADAAGDAAAEANSASQSSSDEAEDAESSAGWAPERKLAEELVSAMIKQWEAPIQTLLRAGQAFEGLEALLAGGGGGGFNLDGGMWRRKGWAEMDRMRVQLEDLKELRDLVRSLGRGGGWGPLRRAPIQFLDLRGRPGLLRTVLEAQETRGLTRSDDISRLLPAEAALLAKGRSNRQCKLLFYSKLAEKSLQTYERDGWGTFDTQINPERREIRPTADRGPILLCVDTSGSMRGPRETVAKALALECMRAARAQERGCYVFAFSGPKEVDELELGTDMKSVDNLLSFLEKVFNGGSDFNEPVRRCLDRLTEAKWANSDILLVSDGELRQPSQEIMRKLSGAKEKLGLRVHGLIVGSPEKKRADPAVLRALCSSILPNGKNEVLVSEFEGWTSVRGQTGLVFDWDDAAGNSARRAAGLRLEDLRQKEIRRKRVENRGSAPKKPRRRKPGADVAAPAPAPAGGAVA